MNDKLVTDDAWKHNSAFSVIAPFHQLAWDSTSLGELKTCPRKYYYTIVMGWSPRIVSVHLIFGVLLHGASERYNHAKFAGSSHDEALLDAFRWVLFSTWDKELKRPWISDDPNKNRLTLARTVVWHLDQFENDPLETLKLANGKPAVELSFQFPLGMKSGITGEQYSLCGHLDRIANFGGKPWIVDIKTTKSTISGGYFAKYTPDNQFSMYMLAGRVAFQFPVEGLIVDAVQVAVTFSRFQRGPVPRSEAQIDEWAHDTATWITVASMYAQRGHGMLTRGEDPEAAWPQNDKNCDMYGGCQFRSICSKPRASRAQWLKAEFHKRQWNPLTVRGDI